MVRRQTDADVTETRVYKYGLVPLHKIHDEAIQELRRSNDLWNNLVEIHRSHRTKFEETRCEAHPAYGEIKERWDEADEKVRQALDAKRTARMRAGTRDANDPLIRDADDEIDRLKKERGEIYIELKPIRAQADKIINEAPLNRAFKDAVKKTVSTKNSRIRGNTADEIKKNFYEARNRAFKSNATLRFHRFDETGYFTYVIRSRRTGLRDTTPSEFFNGDFVGSSKSFKLTPTDIHKRKPRFLLKAKLAGNRGEDGIYQDFHLIYHRPIPKDATIGDCKIKRSRTGDKYAWHLVVTVKTVKKDFAVKDETAVIGIDIGFRQTGNQIQVAVIWDGQKSTRVYVPRTRYKQRRLNPDKPRLNLKGQPRKSSYSSVYADDCVREIETLLDTSAKELGDEITPLMRQIRIDKGELGYGLWKAVAKRRPNVTLSFEIAYKLAQWSMDLEKRKKHNPFPSQAVQAIMSWWRQNSRQFREHHNLRAKVLRRRKDHYRQEAACLVRRGRLIALEKINLTPFAEVKDRNNKLNDKARSQRFQASPSEFRDAIINAAGREGIPVVKVPPQYTSKTCSACDMMNNDLGSEKEWTCPFCNNVHDRDENAARNIAAKGKSLFEDQKNSKPKDGK